MTLKVIFTIEGLLIRFFYTLNKVCTYFFPVHVPRPFAMASMYLSLTLRERLCAMSCGLSYNLIWWLSLGMDRQRTRRGRDHMMWSIARRVAAGLAAAVRNEAAKDAEALCASGQCAAALVPLQRAIDFGDTASRALKAWLLIWGREGFAKDQKRGFELAEAGARLGCHHCQGVLAMCYLLGLGCELDEERSLELACESSGKGSRYGQHTLGRWHRYGEGGLAVDYAQAVALYRLAAAQGLDDAQCSLGGMFYYGNGVAQDDAEALRWWQLAAAQGHPPALYLVADCYEVGCSVAADVVEAIRWYRRAQAAGYPPASDALRRLCALE